MGYLLLSSLFILRKLSSQLSLCPIWTYFFHLVFFSLSSSDLPVLHLPSLYLLPLCPLSLVCTFAFFLLLFFFCFYSLFLCAPKLKYLFLSISHLPACNLFHHMHPSVPAITSKMQYFYLTICTIQPIIETKGRECPQQTKRRSNP